MFHDKIVAKSVEKILSDKQCALFANFNCFTSDLLMQVSCFAHFVMGYHHDVCGVAIALDLHKRHGIHCYSKVSMVSKVSMSWLFYQDVTHAFTRIALNLYIDVEIKCSRVPGAGRLQCSSL